MKQTGRNLTEKETEIQPKEKENNLIEDKSRNSTEKEWKNKSTEEIKNHWIITR